MEIALFPPPDQPWTGAHGFNVDHFSRGCLAMLTGYLTDDLSCEAFADDQMQWVLGNNPLRYCMVGEVGHNNPKVWSMLNDKGGPYAGGIPNGIVGYRELFPLWLVIFSSGEYWLPHNAYYLTLSSLLDDDATVSGRVVNRDDVNPDEQVVVKDGNRVITEIKVNPDGSFGPVNLDPQKKYTLAYGLVSTEITVLSGEQENVILDLREQYRIDIRVGNRTASGLEVEYTITSTCGRDLQTTVPLAIYDGVKIQRDREPVQLKAGAATTFRRTWPLSTLNPVIIRAGSNQTITTAAQQP